MQLYYKVRDIRFGILDTLKHNCSSGQYKKAKKKKRQQQ